MLDWSGSIQVSVWYTGIMESKKKKVLTHSSSSVLTLSLERKRVRLYERFGLSNAGTPVLNSLPHVQENDGRRIVQCPIPLVAVLDSQTLVFV